MGHGPAVPRSKAAMGMRAPAHEDRAAQAGSIGQMMPVQALEPTQTAHRRSAAWGPPTPMADGKLSLDEYSSRALAAFDQADTDKNGTVTIAELRAASGLTK